MRRAEAPRVATVIRRDDASLASSLSTDASLVVSLFFEEVSSRGDRQTDRERER